MPRKNPTPRNRDTDRRRDLRCCICRKRISVDIVPWTEVTLTGDIRSWHPGCEHLRKPSHLVAQSK
jgi:hypothetical protein